MATTINAGRVRFVSRGTYNNSTQYYLFDLVDYNGSSYIAKENTVGNLPTNTQYWQLIAEKGNTGNTGQTGPVGATGNGIASITKTGTSGLVDTYTITYTNRNTTTFTITNGEDGEVTETELDVLRQKVANQQKVIDQLPQVTGQGTSITLENTIEAQFTKFDIEGNSEQKATPSPDYPSEVECCGDNGSINVVICNKNLFNKNTTTDGKYIDGNGSIQTQSNIMYSDYIQIKTNINYYITGRSEWASVALYDKNKTFLERISTTQPNGVLNITNSNCKYIIINALLTDKDTLQLEEGSTATTYIEHQSQSYTIPTQQPMRAIGDVRDKFILKENGKWYERHNIARKIFDGTENWTFNESSINPFGVVLSGVTKLTDSQLNAPNCISNYFTTVAWSETAPGGKFYESEFLMTSLTDNNLRIRNKNYSTLDDFKSWLAEQYNAGTPVYVDYVLATPIDIECTEEQIQQLENRPSTYKDFTIIQSQDETEAYLEVSGIYDLNNLINN